MSLILWLAAAVVPMAGAPATASAESGRTPDASSEPWHIAADSIQYNQQLDLYEAYGNVSITRQGRTLTADKVRFNQKSQDAVAEGNVRMTSDQDTLSASRLDMNLATETGELVDGSIFFHQNHVYLSGDRILKTGPQSYAAEKITVTTCDGPDPDWRITGRDLRVTIEGYGFAKHAALWAGKAPVLYTPYLFFPVKLKRQSGFLMPELGYSTRKGSRYLQPFFWAINDHNDATLFADYMSQRGVRTGLEYRYILTDSSMGTLMADGFTDLKIDDGQDDNSKLWGYDDEPLRINTDRYWVRMKQNQDLFLGLKAKLDIDVVSDQDYLKEFDSGTGGFEASQEYYLETFGRTLDEDDDPIRMNQLNINRSWRSYSFNTNMLWYDDVVKRRNDEADDTVQELPSVSFSGIKQNLAGTPLQFDLNTVYDHFYRLNGTRGQRIDLYPRIYLPLRVFEAISFEPSAGIRWTGWQTYDEDPELTEDMDDTFSRNLYDLKLDLSTELLRIFNAGPVQDDRIKHSVIPQIVYEYTPEVDQDDLPDFDDVDRIDSENQITYSLTNLFTLRRTPALVNPSTEPRYISFLRFKLEQSFDINEYNEDETETGDENQPFSPILAELDLTPGRYVKLDSDARYSVYGGEIVSLNAALTLWNDRKDLLKVDYRFTRPDEDEPDDGVESIRISALVHLGARWQISGAHERNIFTNEDIETLLGVGYRSQCWGVDFEYGIEDDNQSYLVKFNLLGLGSIGN